MTPLLGMTYLKTFNEQLLMLPPAIPPTSSDTTASPSCSTRPVSPLTPLQSHSNPDLPLHLHSPSPTPLGNYPSTPLLDSPQTELLLLRLSECIHMKFLSLLLQSLGMQTVRAWHQEHLALVQKRFDKKNQRRIAAGHIPVQHLYLTSHTAPSVMDPENIATDTQTLTSQHSRSPHCQHPYLSQLQPF
jgi:hypothetical protein